MSVVESKIMEPMMVLEKTQPKMEMYQLVNINQFRGATAELIGCLRHIANVSADPSDIEYCHLAWLCFDNRYYDSTSSLGDLIILAVGALEMDRKLLTSLLIKLERENNSLKNHDGFNFFQQRVSELLDQQRVLCETLWTELLVKMQLVGSPYHHIEYHNVSPPNSEYDSDGSSKHSQEDMYVAPLNSESYSDGSSKHSQEDMYVAPLNSESYSDGSSKQTQEVMYVAPLNSESDSYGSPKREQKRIRPLNLSKKKGVYKRYSKESIARAVAEHLMGKPMKQVVKEYPEIPPRTLYQRSKIARERAIKQLQIVSF